MTKNIVTVEIVVQTKSGLKIRKQEIEVNEEIYGAMMRPEWKEKKRIQRSYKDQNELWKKYANEKIKHLPNTEEKYLAMNGTGDAISSLRMGLPLSLDYINETTHFQAQAEVDVESELHKKLLWEAFYQVLSTFNERDQKIMELLLVKHLSEREVAKQVCCSQKTVNNVKKRLLPTLQEQLKDWR